MNRVLITRPPGTARDYFTQLIGERGFEPLFLPLTSIDYLPQTCTYDHQYQGLIFTSSHAVHGAAKAGLLSSVNLSIPCFVTGPATAELVRDQGFSSVLSANGNADDLLLLVLEHLDPDSRKLLYPRGEKIARSLDEKLTQLGFNLSSPIVYRAVELAVLPDKVKIEFNQRRVAIATFLSPLAAKIFVRLVSESMTTVDLSSTRAICISSNVVEQLKHLNWQTVETARHPNLEQVMALV